MKNLKNKKRVLRTGVQSFSIFLFFFFLHKTVFPLPQNFPVNLYFRMDGLQAVFSTISTGHFSFYFVPAVVLMVIIMFGGNFFCTWICPVGGIIDLCRIPAALKVKKNILITPKFIRKARYCLLYGFLITGLLAFFMKIPHLFWPTDPFVILARAFVLRGYWLVFFICIITISVLIPRLWCNNICPLGCLYYILGVKCRFFLKNKIRKKIKKGCG
jgi:polyferredoxin